MGKKRRSARCFFEPLKGNPAQKSEAANQLVNEVLNNKGTVKTDISKGGIEYRLPDGKGGALTQMVHFLVSLILKIRDKYE